jgi:hypothetical protein
MWAAVAAGVGVTARMDLGAPRTARQADEDLGLPALRSTVLSVTRPDPRASEPVKALEALVKAALGGLAEGGASRRRR